MDVVEKKSGIIFGGVKKVDICYIADENYKIPLAVSIASVLYNAKDDDIRFWIITENSNNMDELKLCNKNIKIVYVDCEKTINNIESKKCNATKISMLKFFIPDILCDVEKVLYLDGDTIVQDDLQQLYSTDIREYFLAAVPDAGDAAELSFRIGIEAEKYFNSGVMLMNLVKMRRDGVVKKLIDYRMNGFNFFQDQDAFNYVCKGKVKYCDLSYNFLSSLIRKKDLNQLNQKLDSQMSSLDELLDMQVVIHLTDSKPWIVEMPFVSRRFMFYYKLSIYKEKKIDLKYPSELKISVMEKKWLNIYKKFSCGDTVAIYGAGKIGKKIYKDLNRLNHVKILAWVDKMPSADLGVKEYTYLKNVSPKYIIIATLKQDYISEMLENLRALDVESNVIFCA
ncbi:MAG: glycosyltransferase family 8 protein [Lachnospiraceae bacterium]|nr:glycosyltransferase family 8 protein [Lachnospiraceae bacterium]